MKVKLIRDLTTERNKEQEDSFESTMNLALYFDINKVIEKADGWRFSNIKKLVSNIDNTTVLNIYYSKWNENIQYIFDNLNIEIEMVIEELSDEIKDSFKRIDIEVIHSTIKDSVDQPNMKLSILLLIADITHDEKVIKIINKVVNGGLSTLDIAIDSVLPILLKGDWNE